VFIAALHLLKTGNAVRWERVWHHYITQGVLPYLRSATQTRPTQFLMLYVTSQFAHLSLLFLHSLGSSLAVAQRQPLWAQMP
jgi:hypothetical protein